MININKLKINPNNPRLIKDAGYKKLMKSLDNDPEIMTIRKIVVENYDNWIIAAGTQRFRALKELGYKEIPEDWVTSAEHLTPEQIKRFIVIDNTHYGEFDYDILANEYEIEFLLNCGIELPNIEIEPGEISISKIKDVDEYQVEQIKTNIILGDQINICNSKNEIIHKIICGDTKNDRNLALIHDTDWDTIIFDPPFDDKQLMEILPKYEKNKKLCLFWDYKSFGEFNYNAYKKGWNGAYEFIWDCVTSWYTPNRPLARHKSCGVYGDEIKYNFNDAIIADGKIRESKVVSNERGSYNYTPLGEGRVHLRTVEQFPTTQERTGHPHSKPLLWISAIIAGIGANTIIDPFLGSGTSMLAAHINSAICIGIELEPTYCQLALNRLLELDSSLNYNIQKMDKNNG